MPHFQQYLDDMIFATATVAYWGQSLNTFDANGTFTPHDAYKKNICTFESIIEYKDLQTSH